MTKKRLFCFGYGYTCDYLAYDLMRMAEGEWDISGTTRDHKKKEQLRARGIDAYMFDFNTPIPDPLYMLRDVTHILISTPPNDQGDTSFLMHASDILNLPKLEWVGYLSTTAPYGDRDGGWVDENSQTTPSTKRGSRRLKAEEQWVSLYKTEGVPVHIFRLSGIYGPGRSALDSVRAGIARRIDKPGHTFCRAHVEDIVQVLIASMNNPKPGEIYNICDDLPAPSHEVIEHACTLLGVEPPPTYPIDDIDMAPMTLSFFADNKRVRNDKIKKDLEIKIKYPDFKKGLQGCLDAEESFN